MLIEAFYILFFYFTGEFISYFIDGFIPGSVIGMVLLFLALAFKVVKPNKVKKLSTLLTENMGLFFLPVLIWLLWLCTERRVSACCIRLLPPYLLLSLS